jgi:hypothetical protein
MRCCRTDFLCVNVMWMLVLKNHSHIHHFAQWWFGIACVMAIAGSVLEFRQIPSEMLKKLRFLYVPATVVFVAILGVTGFTSNQSFHSPSFGTIEDIEVIRLLDLPIVVLNDGSSGPVQWWSGPVIRTYTDPIVSSQNKNVIFADSLSSATLHGKALVLLNSPGIVQGFLSAHRAEPWTQTLSIYVQTESFIFLIAQP